MGKINVKDRDGITRILYQKSNHTIFTQSRTCSGVSQIYTKSGMVNIKRNLSETKQYYIDGDKIKRDLSIETDICIIRRYCKKIKNKRSVQEGSRSKYSTVVDTEIGTIDEFEADTSACGDREQKDQTKNRNVNLDVAKLVVENFKDLLNNWIKQYLLENKDTKDKLETVLYSIIHSSPKKTTPKKSSSRSTYLLNKECLSLVKNKKVSICDSCKNKYANENNIDYENPSHSSPVSMKKIKVISTLSIPRNLHKKEKGTKNKSNHKNKKTKHKNLVLSIKKSSIINFSSYDFLSVSAEAFTKRCTNFKIKKDNKNSKKKRHIVFFPKPFYKSATDTSTEDNYLDELNTKNNLTDMPSLVQSIYAGDPAIIDSSDIDNTSISKIDNFTMTDYNSIAEEIKYRNMNKEKPKVTMAIKDRTVFDKPNINELDRSEPLITIDFINETSNSSTNKIRSIRSACLKSIENKNENNIKKKTISAHDSKLKCWKNKPKKNRYRNYNKITKFQNIQSKQFTFLYKKSNSQYMQSKRFLEHCQNIVKYFTECNVNNDLKLNLHINVIPIKDVTKKDDFTEMSRDDISVITSDTIVFNIEPKIVMTTKNNDNKYEEDSINPEEIKVSEEIIPLLDGTLSQSKYLLKTESSITNTETIGISNDTTLTKDNIFEDQKTHQQRELVEDIRELKTVIKDLAKAAETFLKDHIYKEPRIYHFNNNTTCTVDTNISKGIQISNNAAKQPLISGIKLSKSPKKTDTGDFMKRIMRKSASYNIIDSEMVLRVTDMTSAANTKKSSINLKSKPKSKSLIEINRKRKKKLMAYYCDGGINDDRSMGYKALASSGRKKAKCIPPPADESADDLSAKTEFSDCAGCIHERSMISGNDEEVDDDDDDDDDYYKPVDEEKAPCPVKDCRRKGMGFGEGFIYCVLLWIPVLIIMCLFYNYVVKEVVTPKPDSTVVGFRSLDNKDRNNYISKDLNGSIFYVKLSDLGF